MVGVVHLVHWLVVSQQPVRAERVSPRFATAKDEKVIAHGLNHATSTAATAPMTRTDGDGTVSAPKSTSGPRHTV